MPLRVGPALSALPIGRQRPSPTDDVCICTFVNRLSSWRLDTTKAGGQRRPSELGRCSSSLPQETARDTKDWSSNRGTVFKGWSSSLPQFQFQSWSLLSGSEPAASLFFSARQRLPGHWPQCWCAQSTRWHGVQRQPATPHDMYTLFNTHPSPQPVPLPKRKRWSRRIRVFCISFAQALPSLRPGEKRSLLPQ